jgi:hypothetical protein
MYVPAPPAQAAPALAPVPVVSAADVSFAPRLHTSLVLHESQLDVLAGETAGISGRLQEGHHAARAGQPVKLQARAGSGWRTIAATRTRGGGRFHLSVSPQRLGSEAIRVRFAGDGTAVSSSREAGTLNVFRLAEASWYGGGGTMACGGELTSSTLGVANKTLPCGTLVTLRYGSRTIRVPVVDRGPYVAGREFDLTEATKQALGFAGVGEVWSTS